jgi:peptidoglycan hydrolase CwlO-like protein
MKKNFSIAIAMFACLAIGLAATVSGASDIEDRIRDRQDRRDEILDDVEDRVDDREERRDEILDDAEDRVDDREERREEILDELDDDD